MIKRFIYHNRKVIFAFLVVFSLIQIPLSALAYDISYYPVPEEDSVPTRPLYYGNADPYIPSGVGVSTIFPIADCDVFFSYSTTGSASNYENVSVTVTDIYKSWVDGVLDYNDRTYVLENNNNFGYRNRVSIVDPTISDNAYFYHYDCTFDFGTSSDRLTTMIFRFSDFWYVPLLKNPDLGYTDNIIRDIFSIDIRESYFSNNWETCRISGSFIFMGTLDRVDFDYHDDHLGTIEIGYDDIYSHGLYNEDPVVVYDPVPIYIEDLTIAIPLWNANIDSLRFFLDIPVQLESEHDATWENAFVIDFYAEDRYSGKIEFAFDWLIDSISAFFNAPFFEGLSFGSLVFIVLSFSISTAVIVFLSHMR